jgi:hypothetical protein
MKHRQEHFDMFVHDDIRVDGKSYTTVFMFKDMAPSWARVLCDGKHVDLLSIGSYYNAIGFTEPLEHLTGENHGAA